MSRSRTTQDGEVFPGSERAREAFGSLPTIAHVNSLADAFRQLALSIVSSFQRVLGDIIATKAVESEMVGNMNVGGEAIPFFPFVSWSVSNGFKYPLEAIQMLKDCGSAAEAFFLRELAGRGAEFAGREAMYRGHAVRIQQPCRKYRLDVTVTGQSIRLAIEIDGIGFHHRASAQIAADYLRERRIVAAGYTVIRFTAAEAFGDPAECWRQVDAILDSRQAP